MYEVSAGVRACGGRPGGLKCPRMLPHYKRLPLPALGMIAAVALGLGWLMFEVAGNRAGMLALPDAARGATVMTLADPERRRTIDEVAALPPAAWTAWTGQTYIRAGGAEAVWVRVTLRNATAEARHGLLVEPEYFTDRLDFWEHAAGAPDGWRHRRAGESAHTRDKPVWGRGEAFPIDLPAGAERTFYLRFEDRFAVWARVVWWPRVEDFLAAQVRDVLAEGLCYGGVLALLLYNAMLWLRLRHVDTGYYVLYATAMLAANTVSNNVPALLGVTIASPGKEMITIASLTLSAVFLIQFARAFLESAARTPRADRLARGLRSVFIVMTAVTLLIPWMRNVDWVYFVVPLAALTHGLVLFMAVTAWRGGARHARFFIVSFGVMFAGGLPSVAIWMQQLVTKQAAMGVVVGSTLEILLLALAVADRFARMQRERAEAQERLVEETEQRRAIQEAYADELEVEVRERTHELEAANADKDRMLTLLGHDLRSPLTAVTQTAEQIRGGSRAPLPVPAAEPLRQFAGEVADAGRQMLLLIEDIVLWSRLRVGAAPVPGKHAAGAVVHPAVRLHAAAAARRGVEISVQAPPELAVRADLVLAQALVRNLVGNAVKFARRRVQVEARRSAAGVTFTVADDGAGLPEDVRERLLGRPVGEERGFGLRLCQEIAGTLGVRLEAAAPEGGGTEMRITLPAAETAAVPGEAKR